MPIVLTVAFCLATLNLQRVLPFPGEFDELQHISYAAHLQESGTLLPEFAEQKVLSKDDLGRWAETPNYIGHPSPFYVVVGLLLDRALPPQRAVVVPRLASAALLWAAVAAVLAAGFGRFEADRTATAVFCFAVALCPKLVAVSGQVSNDALAFLGGALAYAGADARRGRDCWAHLSLALGVAFACWAKPNAALAVGLWLAARVLAQGRPDPGFLLAVCAGAALGSVPYADMLWRYGAVVPVAAEHLGGPEMPRVQDVWSYALGFPFFLGFSWPISETGGPATVASFWLVVSGAAFAGALAWQSRREPNAAMAVAAPVAFFLVLPIHFWVAATSLGCSVPAASFRYYLPLWPALAHAICFGAMAAAKPWQRTACVWAALVGLAAGWLSP